MCNFSVPLLASQPHGWRDDLSLADILPRQGLVLDSPVVFVLAGATLPSRDASICGAAIPVLNTALVRARHQGTVSLLLQYGDHGVAIGMSSVVCIIGGAATALPAGRGSRCTCGANTRDPELLGLHGACMGNNSQGMAASQRQGRGLGFSWSYP
jgi:hypothetical protein